MNFYFPTSGSLCMAENCSRNLHNVYTLRGAQVRDALAWSRYIDESIELFLAAPTSCSPATTGRAGATTTCSTTSRSSATCTATSTTRRCGWRTTGRRCVEIAEELELPAVARGSSVPRATTAPSTTT